MKDEKQEYEVTSPRQMFGQFRDKGEKMTLTQAQAKYYTAPFGSGLKPTGTQTSVSAPSVKPKSSEVENPDAKKPGEKE